MTSGKCRWCGEPTANLGGGHFAIWCSTKCCDSEARRDAAIAALDAINACPPKGGGWRASAEDKAWASGWALPGEDATWQDAPSNAGHVAMTGPLKTPCPMCEGSKVITDYGGDPLAVMRVTRPCPECQGIKESVCDHCTESIAGEPFAHRDRRFCDWACYSNWQDKQGQR